VIIAGCGRVGSTLATQLSISANEVAIVDHNPDSFEFLGPSFTGSTHVGKAFDRATLESAGIERADAFVAVTSGDNSNVVSAIVAKEVFRVPRVIARIYDPRRAEIYRRLGLQAVSSVSWATHEIMVLLAHTGLATQISFGDGQVRIVTAEVPPRLHERTVGELEQAGEISVIAVVRAGRSFMPVAGTPLAAGDMISAAVVDGAVDRLDRMIAP